MDFHFAGDTVEPGPHGAVCLMLSIDMSDFDCSEAMHDYLGCSHTSSEKRAQL